MTAPGAALQPETTVAVAHVGHRLALGVQWLDALAQRGVGSDWTSELLAIGARPCPQATERHAQGRHALRAAGRLARLLQRAAADKLAAPPASSAVDPTNFVLRGFGRSNIAIDGYAGANDPRRHVPRRLSLTPAQSSGWPSAGVDNIRTAWLWPAAAYPLAGGVTALRGRVRRGAAAAPVAWTRIVVTRPGPAPADFDTETAVGWAHGDDRGEFLALLGVGALPGGAELPASIALRVWVFVPPTDGFDAADPLASLPLEVAGSEAINDTLRGTAIPAGYLRMAAVDVTLAPGSVLTLGDAQLLFV